MPFPISSSGTISVSRVTTETAIDRLETALREGFGLVVAEALWKGVPVVAGKVGGIVIQIQDGVSGYLVTSVEECAARSVDLLRDATLRKRMATAGREHVRRNFLITRDLRDQLELVTSFAKVSPAAS